MNFSDDADPGRVVGERTARRRRQRDSGPSRSAIVVALVLVLGVLGVAGWAIWPSGGGTASTAPASRPLQSSTGSSGTGTATNPPSSSPAPAPASFTACRSEVSRGDALAAAGAKIAADWQGHTSALTRLDKGQITVREADAIWKRTKLAGPADMARYRVATAASATSKGACAQMGPLPKALAPGGVRCVQRANAQADVAAKVTPVSAAWAAHLASMKVKDDTPVGPYMAKWHQQVAGAPKILTAYRTAVSALSGSPTCPTA